VRVRESSAGEVVIEQGSQRVTLAREDTLRLIARLYRLMRGA
jgi:hypothetical protein